MSFAEDFTATGGPFDGLQEAFGEAAQWTYRRFLADGSVSDTTVSVILKENVPDSLESRQETYQLRVLVKTSALPARAERNNYMIDPDGKRYAIDDFEVLMRSGMTRLFLVGAQERV